MEKFSFLLTLVVIYNILSYIKGLTVLPQQRSIDIVQGMGRSRPAQGTERGTR